MVGNPEYQSSVAGRPVAAVVTGSLDANGAFQASSPTNGAATTIVGPAGSATVFAAGSLRVDEVPTQLFFDSFNTGLDTTNTWVTPTTGGNGIAATNTVGATVLDGGTTLNSFSELHSQNTFILVEPGFLFTVFRVNFEFPVVTTAYRFWGYATAPGTPTIAAPLTQAIGWEVATSGKMYAVSYATGTRVVVQDLSTGTGNGKQPADANVHKYYMWVSGGLAYWAIDSLDNTVATMPTGALGPDVNSWPLKALVISNSGTHATLQLNAVVVGDTGRNTNQIVDGTYPWRKATVDTTGSLKGISALVPAAAGVLGSYMSSLVSGVMAAGLAANSPIVAFRYAGGGSNLALIRKILLSADDLGTGFTAGTVEFDLFAARAFTASDSGGTSQTLTGNNAKLRTSYATSGVANFQAASTGTLTPGTRTLDTSCVNRLVIPVTTGTNIVIANPGTALFDQRAAEQPMILANNEGFVILATVPATGTWTFAVTVMWDEVASF